MLEIFKLKIESAIKLLSFN